MLEQVLQQTASKCLSKHQANRKQSTEFREKNLVETFASSVTYVPAEAVNG